MSESRVILFKQDIKSALLFQIQPKHIFSGGAAWIAGNSDRDGHNVKEALDVKCYFPLGYIKIK